MKLKHALGVSLAVMAFLSLPIVYGLSKGAGWQEIAIGTGIFIAAYSVLLGFLCGIGWLLLSD